MGTMSSQAMVGALLALVFARPIERVALRQLHLAIHLPHGFFHGAAQVTTAHAVLDGDVALIAFAINHGRAVFHGDVAELIERHTLAAGGSKRMFSISSTVLRNCG